MRCPQCQTLLPPGVTFCPKCKIDVALHCSFCSKSQHDVRKLIAGPGVYICDECIQLCIDIIAEEWQEETRESSLQALVTDFAHGLRVADARRPQAVNQRSGKPFAPGIGPHTEAETLKLVLREMCTAEPNSYLRVETNVPYPTAPRKKCDLLLHMPDAAWFVEVKLIRLVGDNGKPNDNLLMHVLSPYPSHRSALTDCEKLIASGFQGRKALLLYGYECQDWPLATLIDAFEALAKGQHVSLGPRHSASFEALCHPIHQAGEVHAWEVLH